MADKSKLNASTAKQASNTAVDDLGTNQKRAVSVARTTLRPQVKGAVTINCFSRRYGDLDLLELVGELSDQTKAVNDGSLARAEGMLAVQAHTLDAIFNDLAQRASAGEYVDTIDKYLRLALKAQNQCRATLETLAALKNPASVAFVRQANIANGPQQVNNGVTTGASRAEKTENRPNKVLEQHHGERMECGATCKAGSADTQMEAMEAVYRPQYKNG